MTALLPALLLAGASATAGNASLEAAITQLYLPYHRAADSTAVWERPVFSAATSALIARWRAVAPADEPDDLDDGDWLCLCQDWDSRRFRATIVSRAIRADGRATVEVRLDLGTSEQHRARLLLVSEGGGWKLDDLYATDFPRGLKQALRETIARERRR